MTPITLLLMISFVIFKARDYLEFLTLILTSDSVMCANCFKIMDLISFVIKTDFHDLKNFLASKIITEVFEHNFDGYKPPFLDIIIDFIAFNFNVIYPRKMDNESHYSIVFLLQQIQNKQFELPFSTFHLTHDNNGKWADLNLVEHSFLRI